MALEQLNSGGRRLRARLALSASEVFGVDEASAVTWAACVELLHNATLVHDDIQDADRLRRGQATVWARYGVPQAINVGDFLLVLPYVALREIRAEHRGALALLLGETSTRVVRGQVYDLALLDSGRLDPQEYYAAVRGKTGALFELPVSGAALLGNLGPERVARYGELFSSLGLLFQMQDDIVDLYGDKGKDGPGADVREGKVSALIVELIAARPGLRSRVLQVLRKTREETTPLDVEWIAQVCRESGTLMRVLEQMQAIADHALASVARTDPSLRALVSELIQMCSGPLTSLKAASHSCGSAQGGP